MTKVELPDVPDNFSKNGFEYTTVLAGTRSLIFRQRISESIDYFEVFKLRYNRPWNIGGKNFPASFRVPENEAFGDWAWTYRTLEGATTKFNELEGTGQKNVNERGGPDKWHLLKILKTQIHDKYNI